MKAFWSEEKCGDPLFIVNRHTLWKILEKELKEEYKTGYGYVFNRIVKGIEDAEIDGNFEHITQEKFDEFAKKPTTKI